MGNKQAESLKYEHLSHSCMEAVTGNGIWGQLFFSVTASKVRVIGPKGLCHQSFPGSNLGSLLKEFGDLSVVDQQNYKALHRILSIPPTTSANQGDRKLP